MALWQNRYRIETARKIGWDYSCASWYFVTVCEVQRLHAFGEIGCEEVELAPLGELATRSWSELPHHFGDVVLDEWKVMPDHFHGLLWLDGSPLGDIMNGFKGSVTRANRRQNLGDFKWQERFHDRIVRTEEELNNIRFYIRNNVPIHLERGDYQDIAVPVDVFPSAQTSGV